ncbi:ABC transporter substrate-binding protein [Sulfobacillus harzensis]|uniref:ABC transporter substrate-binding protein n=1 Tax=Sulfobacillus harzensis TaxID=2729629 RepID=UPI003B830060
MYHVYLGSKWRWSNGQPVTAQDLLFTWHVVQAASAASAPAPWPFVGGGTGDIPSGIRSVVENNAHEVTFTLRNPANQQWFIYNGLIQLTPMPAKQLDKYGSNWAREIQYLGSIATNPKTAELASDGPYELKSASPNQTWVLVPNPHYAGHRSLVNRLVFAYESSSSAEFSALKTGTVDLGYLDPTQLGAASQLTQQGDKVFAGHALSVFWTALNMYPGTTDAALFDNLYIREALEMGIDQSALIQDIHHGYALPQYGPIPSAPKTVFYDAKAEPPIPYSISDAKKLLESHGWHEHNGVMTNRAGQTLTFRMIYVSGSQAVAEEAQLMQADWAKMGVRVSLKGVNFNSYLTETHDKTSSAWQMAVGSGWYYNGPGWYPTGGQLFQTGAPTGHGFSNQHEDHLIAATHQPYATTQQTMQVFDRYEAYTAKELPMLWMPDPASINVTAETLHGGRRYANPATGNPAFNRMWVSR